MSELLPCPFCGGEAEINWFSHRGRKWKVRVCCRKCAGNVYERATTHYHDCINDYASEDEAEAAAIKEWNTRHERMCHVVNGLEPYCSECGAKVVEE